MTEQATVKLYIEESKFNDYNAGEVVPAYATDGRPYTKGRTIELTVPTKEAVYISRNKELQATLSKSHVSYALCNDLTKLTPYLYQEQGVM
ncbi:MAG: hypothetical protein ABS904_00990 [Solibacillus isronensis]